MNFLRKLVFLFCVFISMAEASGGSFGLQYYAVHQGRKSPTQETRVSNASVDTIPTGFCATRLGEPHLPQTTLLGESAPQKVALTTNQVLPVTTTSKEDDEGFWPATCVTQTRYPWDCSWLEFTGGRKYKHHPH